MTNKKTGNSAVSLKKLDVDGLTVYLQKKAIRHLYIRVSMKDGSVHVSAPLRMSLNEICSHIFERRAWIEKQRSLVKNSSPSIRRELPANAGLILKKRLDRIIAPCECLVGQHAAGYRLKDMSSRWGSCSLKTHLISLNIRLYDKDDDCLRYVLIHELCHFYEPNHSPAFYAYLDRFCPDWRSARKRLSNS